MSFTVCRIGVLPFLTKGLRWAKWSLQYNFPTGEKETISVKLWSHLLFLWNIVGELNRNPSILEFGLRTEKFSMQIILVFNLIMWIRVLINRKLLGLKETLVWAVHHTLICYSQCTFLKARFHWNISDCTLSVWLPYFTMFLQFVIVILFIWSLFSRWKTPDNRCQDQVVAFITFI